MKKATYISTSPLDNPEPSHEGVAYPAHEHDADTFAFYPSGSDVGYYVSREELKFED